MKDHTARASAKNGVPYTGLSSLMGSPPRLKKKWPRMRNSVDEMRNSKPPFIFQFLRVPHWCKSTRTLPYLTVKVNRCTLSYQVSLGAPKRVSKGVPYLTFFFRILPQNTRFFTSRSEPKVRYSFWLRLDEETRQIAIKS